MLLSLDSGVSALEQFQQSLNVIANNIANVNTVGFKSATVDFADTLSQTLGANATGTMQVGTGIMTSSINNQFTPGSISSTGNQTDMAVNGNGFFLVKDPTTGSSYVTRDGEFNVDSNGYLVTSTGMRVQGYTDAGLTTVGDIQINNTGAPGSDTSAVQSYTFNSGWQNLGPAGGRHTIHPRAGAAAKFCESPTTIEDRQQPVFRPRNRRAAGCAHRTRQQRPGHAGHRRAGNVQRGSRPAAHLAHHHATRV